MNLPFLFENARTHLKRNYNMLHYDRSFSLGCEGQNFEKCYHLLPDDYDTNQKILRRKVTNLLIIIIALLDYSIMKNGCVTKSTLKHFILGINSYLPITYVARFIKMCSHISDNVFSNSSHKMSLNCLSTAVSFIVGIKLLFKNTRSNLEQVSSESNMKLLLKLLSGNNCQFVPIQLLILGVLFVKTFENLILYSHDSSVSENHGDIITKEKSSGRYVKQTVLEFCSDFFSNIPQVIDGPKITSHKIVQSKEMVNQKNKPNYTESLGNLRFKDFKNVYGKICYLSDYLKSIGKLWNVFDRGKFSITLFYACKVHANTNRVQVWNKKLYSSNTQFSGSANCNDLDILNSKNSVSNQKYICLNLSQRVVLMHVLLVTSLTLLYAMLMNIKTLRFLMNVTTISMMTTNTCANFTNQKAGCAYSSSSDASECSTPRISRNAKKTGQSSRSSEIYAKIPGSASDLTLNVTTPLGKKKRYESGDLGSNSNLDEDSEDYYRGTKKKLVNYQVNPDIPKNIPGRKPKQRKKNSKPSSSRYDRGEYVDTKDDKDRFDLILHRGRTTKDRRRKSPISPTYIEKGRKSLQKNETCSEYTLDAISTDSDSDDSYKVLKKVLQSKNQMKMIESPIKVRRTHKDKVTSRSENAKVLENVKRPPTSTKGEKYRPTGPDKRVFSTLYTNKNVCDGSSLEAITKPHFNNYKSDASPKKKLPSKYFQEYISTDESEFTDEDLEDKSYMAQDRFYETSAADNPKKQNHEGKKQKGLELRISPQSGKKRKPERKSTREFVVDKRKKVRSIHDVDKYGMKIKSNAKEKINYLNSKPMPHRFNSVRKKRKHIEIKSDQKQKTCDCTPAKRNRIACKNEQLLTSSGQYGNGQKNKNTTTRTSPKNRNIMMKLNQGDNMLFHDAVSYSPIIIDDSNESKCIFSKSCERKSILPEYLQESMNTISQRLETKLFTVNPKRQCNVRSDRNEWPRSVITNPAPVREIEQKSENVTKDVLKKYTNQIAINPIVFQPISVLSDFMNSANFLQNSTSKQKSDDSGHRNSSLPSSHSNEINQKLLDNANECNGTLPVKKKNYTSVEFSNKPIIQGVEKNVCHDDIVIDIQENKLISGSKCDKTPPETEYFVFENKELLSESIDFKNTSTGLGMNKEQDVHQILEQVDCEQDKTILQLITDVTDTMKSLNISTELNSDSIGKDKINEFIKCAVDIFKILEKTKGNTEGQNISGNVKDYLNTTLQNFRNITTNKPEGSEVEHCNSLECNHDSPFDKNILVYNQVMDKNILNLRNQEIQTAFSNSTKIEGNKKNSKAHGKYNEGSDTTIEHHSTSNHTASTYKTFRTSIINQKPWSDKCTKICHVCTKKMHVDNAKECAVQCSKNYQNGSCYHNPKCEHKTRSVMQRKGHSVSSLSTDLSYLDTDYNPTKTDPSICPYYPEGECSSKCDVCNMIFRNVIKCRSFSSSNVNDGQHSLSRFNLDFADDSEVNVLYHLGKNPNCKQCKFINQYKDKKCLLHKVEDTVSHNSRTCHKLAMNIAVGCNLVNSKENHCANVISNEDLTVLKVTCSTHQYPITSNNNNSSSPRHVATNKHIEIGEEKSDKTHDKLEQLTAMKHEKELLQVIPYKSKMSEVASQHTIPSDSAILKEDVYSKVKKVCRDTIQKGFQKYSKQYKSCFGKSKINQKPLAEPTDIPVLEKSIVSRKFGTVVVSKGSYPRDSDTYILTNNETSGDDMPPPVPRRPYNLLPRAVHDKYSDIPPPLPRRKYCLMNTTNDKPENIAKHTISHKYGKSSELSYKKHDSKKADRDKSNTTFTRDLTTSDTKEMSCDEEIDVPRETVFYYTSKKGSQCFMGDVLRRKAKDKPCKELNLNKTPDFHAGSHCFEAKKKVNHEYFAQKYTDFEKDSIQFSIENNVNFNCHTTKLSATENSTKRKSNGFNETPVKSDVRTNRLPSKHVRKSSSDFQISCTNKCKQYTEDENPECETKETYVESKKLQTTVLSPTSKHSKGKVSNNSWQKKKEPLKSYKSHSCSKLSYPRKDCKDSVVQTELVEKDNRLKYKEFNKDIGDMTVKATTRSIGRESRELEKYQPIVETNGSRNLTQFLGNPNVSSNVTNAMCIRSVNEVYFQVPRSNADDRPFSESISIEETEDGSENILVLGDIAVIPKIDKNIEIFFKNTTRLDGVQTIEKNTCNREHVSSIFSHSPNTGSCKDKFTSNRKHPCHDLRALESPESEINKVLDKLISYDILKDHYKFSSDNFDNISKPFELDSVKLQEPKKNERMIANHESKSMKNGTQQEALSGQKVDQVESDTIGITPLDSFEDDLYIQGILQECLQKQKCENSYTGYFSSGNCFDDDFSYGCHKVEYNKPLVSDTMNVSKIETCVKVYDYEDSKIDSVLLEAKKLTACNDNLSKRAVSGKYVQNQKEFANMIEEISDCLLKPKVDDYFFLTEPIITDPLDMLGKYKLKEDSLPDKSSKKDVKESDNSSILSRSQIFTSSGAGRSNKDSYHWNDLIEIESGILEPIENLNISDNSDSDVVYRDMKFSDALNFSVNNKLRKPIRQNTKDVVYFEDNTKHEKDEDPKNMMKNNYDALWEQFKDVLQVFRYVENHQSKDGQVNTTISHETLGDMNTLNESNDSIHKLILDLISGNQFTRIRENMFMEITKKYDADVSKLQEDTDGTANNEIVEESNVMSEIQLKLTLDKLEIMKERLMKLKGSTWIRENGNYRESESSDTALNDTSTDNYDKLPRKNYLDNTSDFKPGSFTSMCEVSSTTCKPNGIEEDLPHSCWTRENATQHFIKTKLYETIIKKNSFHGSDRSLSKSYKDVTYKMENESTTSSQTEDLRMRKDSDVNLPLPCYPVNYHTVSYRCPKGVPKNRYQFQHNRNIELQSISSIKSENIDRIHRKDRRKHCINWESSDKYNYYSTRDRRFRKLEVSSKTSKSEPSISASRGTFKGWSTKSDRRCSDRSFASSGNRYETCLKDNCLDVGKYAEIGGKIADKRVDSSDFALSEITTTLDSCKVSVGLHMEDDANEGLFW